MDDSFLLSPPEKTKDGWLKHIHKEGSRQHVLSYSTNGVHCSEKNCIVNKENNFPDSQNSIFL